MRIAGAAAVLLVFRVAALAGHQLAWSIWSPVAYLWQDTLVLLLYAILDRALAKLPQIAWTVYTVFVIYVVCGTPVMRVMSTPMTLTMWRAAGGAIGDSIRYYLTLPNVAWMAAAAGASVVAWEVRPGSVPGLSRVRPGSVPGPSPVRPRSRSQILPPPRTPRGAVSADSIHRRCGSGGPATAPRDDSAPARLIRESRATRRSDARGGETTRRTPPRFALR